MFLEPLLPCTDEHLKQHIDWQTPLIFLGNNRSLTLDQPREDITFEEVQDFMEYVIEVDVYHPSVEDAESYLAFINGATLTRKTVETLELSK